MFTRTGNPVRSGVRLAVDPGTVRIGVARSDPGGVIATPLTALSSLAAAEEALEIWVGLPRSLSGREGPAAVTARQFAADLADRVAPLPVRLVDERFTTSTAHGALAAAGHDSRARRQTVDAGAAAVVLGAALESERRTGQVPGDLVMPRKPGTPRGGGGGGPGVRRAPARAVGSTATTATARAKPRRPAASRSGTTRY